MRHFADGLRRDGARPSSVSLDTDFERHVEEEGFYFGVVKLGEANILAAFPASQVGGIDVGFPPSEREPLADQVSHGREDAPVDGLIGGVVREKAAQFV